jgi:hypothetical protein
LNLLPDITHRANDVDPWDGPQIGQNVPRCFFSLLFHRRSKNIKQLNIFLNLSGKSPKNFIKITPEFLALFGSMGKLQILLELR